ncbi:MAG: riboflavin biosynthesis protein RibF [Clostridia bacterium]|nr:riboflavin biosynthesis protein RibF [Clostridia bacterium]
MDIYRLSAEQSNLPAHPRSIAIGVFDGVHRAHREVIEQVIGVEGMTPTVLTFSGSPHQLPKHARALATRTRKQELLQNLGVKELLELDFEEIRALSPTAFVQDILHDKLHAGVVACGENFRFGHGGSGDLHTLQTLCEPLGIRVIAVPTLLDGGLPISSTRIRGLIAAGDIAEANRLLGSFYTIRETVVDGNHLGRTAGFPTVNQPLPEDAVWPAFGVYAATVLVDGKSYIGVTNIGRKPTVGSDRPLAETWILDYEGDLYGRTLTLWPVKFIRPERTFPTTDALFAQVAKDAEMIREMFRPTGKTRAVLFDLDDTLHSRVEAWRAFARRYVDRLLPDRSESERAAHAHRLWERGGCGHGYPTTDFVDFYTPDLIAGLKEDAGLPQSLEELVDLYLPMFPEHTTVFPDAVPTLVTLREQGYKVGFITNGPSLLQNRKLHFSGLLPLMDCAVVAGDEGVSKPDPELFIRTALRLGVAPEDCVYVGDNPRADIGGAKSAGLRPVYIDRTDERFPVGDDVPRITELKELFSLL